eukprot:1402485-Pyramimonas_sp.AAC.1
MPLDTYADNRVAPGRSPEAAGVLLEDCGLFLAQNWRLQYGERSTEFLVCRGYRAVIAAAQPRQQRN